MSRQYGGGGGRGGRGRRGEGGRGGGKRRRRHGGTGGLVVGLRGASGSICVSVLAAHQCQLTVTLPQRRVVLHVMKVRTVYVYVTGTHKYAHMCKYWTIYKL